MQNEVVWNPWLPPALLLTLTALLAVLAVVASWRARRGVPAWVAWTSVLLRLIALACLCLLVLRPERVREEEIEKRRPLLLLVDDSQSMLLRDAEDGPTRAEEGQEALAQILEAAASRKWELAPFDLGETLLPRQAKDARFRGRAPVSPLGERLAEALTATQQDARLASPGAVLLLSDGSVNRGRSLANAARSLGERGLPLFVIILGRPRVPTPDAQLTGLVIRPAEKQSSGEPVRAGSRMVAEAQGTLLPGGPKLTGPLADTAARLSLAGPLTEEGLEFKETGVLRHRLPQSPAWTPVRMIFTAPESGFYRVRLQLDALENEKNLANNVVYGSFEVLPPRKRAVYIASRLGHDYRHLRDLFTGWDGPTVEIVADFLTARDETGAAVESTANEVLAQWLGEGVPASQRGGTLIWAEPDFKRVPKSTQAKLRAALQSGALSLLWMINEDAGSLRRRLLGSPLEDTFLFGSMTRSENIPRPAPTAVDAGAHSHPALRWAFKREDDPDPFREFPAVAAHGNYGKLHEPSRVLLRSGDKPLLCVGKVGQGRVAVLLTGESWRWLAPLRGGLQAKASRELCVQLWKGLIEWLADTNARADPPVRLYLAKDEWTLGEQLRARLVARMPDPRWGLQVECDVTRLQGGVTTAPKWRKWTGDASEPEGAWDASLPLDAGRGRLRAYSGAIGKLDVSGEWLLRARALLPDGRELGRDRMQFIVRGAPLEQQSTGPDREALESAVAAATVDDQGGCLIDAQPAEIARMLDEMDPWLEPERRTQVTRTSVVSLTGLLGLLILALLVDIWLKRGV